NCISKENLIAVATAVIVFRGQLLLLQRDDNLSIKDPGCWQLPGGGVEMNETSDEAIRRELKEEINVVPDCLKLFMSPYTGMSIYYGKLTEEESLKIRKGSEGKDLQFFSLEELFRIPLTHKLKLVVEQHKTILESLLK
ncbi:MAG: NUDIX domain-containing protein, partial [bacterium]|nr:NUDIX domain-containing protein [bacterium]